MILTAKTRKAIKHLVSEQQKKRLDGRIRICMWCGIDLAEDSPDHKKFCTKRCANKDSLWRKKEQLASLCVCAKHAWNPECPKHGKGME